MSVVAEVAAVAEVEWGGGGKSGGRRGGDNGVCAGGSGIS